MQPVNFRKFKKKFEEKRKSLERYITGTGNNPPHNPGAPAVQAQVNYCSCASRCNMMLPAYAFRDIKTGTAHLGMGAEDFREKWLFFNKRGYKRANKCRPCRFPYLKSNMSPVYEVRPAPVQALSTS